MKIAVIATTEGAGSTFVSTNLTYACNGNYLDLSKNKIGHTFFESENKNETQLFSTFATLKNSNCNECNNCVSACLKKKFFINEETAQLFCEGCPQGECQLSCQSGLIEICDKKACDLIIEKSGKCGIYRPIGELLSFQAVAECALKHVEQSTPIIIDCPTSDSAYTLNCLSLCDYCVVVVEPGVFDFENFKSLIRLCKLANKPYGVIINKLITPYDKLNDYCNLHSTEVLARIPFNARDAKLISAGKLIAKEKFTYKQYFSNAFAVFKKKIK